MRIASLSLAQKIAATITLFSLCIAALLFIGLDYAQKKSMQDIAVRFIEASSLSMQKNLHKNNAAYEDIRMHLEKNYASKAEDFWHSIVDNSLTNLPPNFHAFIVDNHARVLSPKVRVDIIKPQLIEKKLHPPFSLGATTLETAHGRVTYISRTLKEDELYLYMYYRHESFEDLVWQRKHILILVTIGIILIGLFWARILSRHLARPLQKLNLASLQLSHADLVHENILQTLPKLPVQRQDEIGSLARSFQNMAETLQKNIQKTIVLTAEHEKVESELRLAQNIQQSMLPQDFSSAYQEKSPFTMHGMVLPARDVGGDLYDIFWLDEDNFCFVIGDVSDKGVPAALFMSMTLTLLRLLMRTPMLHHNPAKCLEYANNTLCQNNTSNMFVTLIVGTVNCANGQMVYANAGHMPPCCIHKNNDFEVLPTHKELVIATFEDVTYKNISYQLQHGDRVFFYTDGVTEASNVAGQRFGDEALQAFLTQNNTLSPKDLNTLLVQHVQKFSEDCSQYDDITILNFLWKTS